MRSRDNSSDFRISVVLPRKIQERLGCCFGAYTKGQVGTVDTVGKVGAVERIERSAKGLAVRNNQIEVV